MELAKELVKGKNEIPFYPELHDEKLMEEFLKEQNNVEPSVTESEEKTN
jgi:hypothetical protein